LAAIDLLTQSAVTSLEENVFLQFQVIESVLASIGRFTLNRFAQAVYRF
jgi:hypothetical protein